MNVFMRMNNENECMDKYEWRESDLTPLTKITFTNEMVLPETDLFIKRNKESNNHLINLSMINV